MMKKQLISAAGIMLAALSLGAITEQSVDAATIDNPIKQGKTFNLTRHAAVYDRYGTKVGTLRKGRPYKVLAIKTINGDKYVKIRKNRFIKAEAFLPYIKSTVQVVHRIKKYSCVYDVNGNKIPGKFLKRGSEVQYLGHKEINEKPFIKIAEGQYIKALNVLTTINN